MSAGSGRRANDAASPSGRGRERRRGPGRGWLRPVAGHDAGFSSVIVLSLASVVALVAMVLVALGVVATTRQRAATAADLGALAAAARVLQGPGPACATAAAVAQAQGGQLISCRVEGELCEVAVQVRPAGPLARFGTAHGVARAGPAGRLVIR